jgi:hypothetical protein
MGDQESNKEPRTNLSEGILIAIASSGAYLLAFYYEKGFSSFFEIPVNFVSVSFVNIFIFGTFLIGFLVLFFLPANIVTLVLFRLPPELSRSVFPVLLCLVFIAVHLYTFGLSNWTPLVIGVAVALFFLLFELVWPLIMHRDRSRYIEKLEAQRELDKKEVNLVDLIQRLYGIGPIITILALLLGINFSESVGKAQAMKQTDFLVTNTSLEMVVLQIYGENMICAPFNRDTKEVQTRFTIIKMAEDSKLAFNLEKVGPLHPVRFQPAESSVPLPSNTH